MNVVKQADLSEDSIRRVVDTLNSSKHPSDQRKGWDLEQLLRLSCGEWRGRLRLAGLASAEDRSLVLICQVRASGPVWAGTGAQICDRWWTLALALPHRYPLSAPAIQFLDPIPFNPHVIHPDPQFRANPAGLPAELQEWTRNVGRGGQMCYLASSQWSADALMMNLTVVLWQVVRILTGAKTWGENVSLNQAARDWFNLGREAGRVPFGPSLPFPCDREPAASSETDEDDVDWAQPEGGVA